MRPALAHNGDEAIRLLEGDLTALDHAPRLVLLDVKLPKLGGLMVLERVRADLRTTSIPVVCLKSSDEFTNTTKAFGLDANAFVRKPVDYDHYLDLVAMTVDYWLTVTFWPA